MRLDYSILWFEDDEEFVNLKRPDIEEYLKDLGFTANIRRRRDDKFLKRVLRNSDVNLILVDYNLAEEKKGDRLIEAIRNTELYTEVVFYSQIPGFRSKIVPQLQGVFYAKGDELLEKTKKVIDITIKKNQDINNVRGLFIAEAIDIVTQLEGIIVKILKIRGEPLRIFSNHVMQQEFFNDYEKYKLVLNVVQEKVKTLRMIANGRYSRKQKQEASSTLTEIEPLLTKLVTMENEVIQLRNLLAHSKPSSRNKKALVCEKGLIQFDETKCRETRRQFNDHSSNLTKVHHSIRTILSAKLPSD